LLLSTSLYDVSCISTHTPFAKCIK
jgi:hypothetical protein